jgi:hypothetical protein
MKPFTSWVGILTKTNGTKHIVFMSIDKAYVWDKLFEDIEDRHGDNLLDGQRTRAGAIKLAKRLGYSVEQAVVTMI